jgi:L-galactose dehydrogenase/L-glyceraldehyde 3-phosphate reductase
VQISTKFNLRPEDLGDIAGAVERSLAASLGRLRRDRIELLQLHNHLGEGSPRHIAVRDVLRPGGVADALARLKSSGLIRAAGMTAAGDTQACLEVIESGRFDTAQVYFNLLNPSARWTAAPARWSPQDFSGIVAACAGQGMGILNIRVFAGGALASPVRHGREFVMASGSDVDTELRRAGAVRRALGDSGAQAALRFCLAQPEFSTCVVGLADVPQLDQALEAVRLGPLPASPALERLWQADFA